MKALLRLYGNVQGVNCRSFCRHLARELELSGLARNEPDDTVSVFLDGNENAIEAFVEKVKLKKPSGVFGIQVERIEFYKEGQNGFKPAWQRYVGFEIDRGL